jgi:hypothetical protein
MIVIPGEARRRAVSTERYGDEESTKPGAARASEKMTGLLERDTSVLID